MLFKQEINTTIAFLKEAKTILYPTDTVWGIGCDATNENAVKQVYQLKNRTESKSLIILVADIDMLQNIIKNIPAKALEIIKNDRPTSIIYDKPIGLAKNLIAADNTVGIRVVQDAFCKKLIQEFGKPIVSTSANISGDPTPLDFSEINETIKQKVAHIVNITPEFSKKPSRIIKISKQHCVVNLWHGMPFKKIGLLENTGILKLHLKKLPFFYCITLLMVKYPGKTKMMVIDQRKVILEVLPESGICLQKSF